MWAVPPDLLDESAESVQIAPLDLDREKQRYGATTVSTG